MFKFRFLSICALAALSFATSTYAKQTCTATCPDGMIVSCSGDTCSADPSGVTCTTVTQPRPNTIITTTETQTCPKPGKGNIGTLGE